MQPLVGNRIAAAGAVLYFLEWVAIAFFPAVALDRLGDDTASIVEPYEGEARVVALTVGWFSLVLLGRVLFVLGVRKAVRDSRATADTPLLDFAVAAMAVSVALEVASLSFAAAAAWIVENDGSADAVVALDAAASVTFVVVLGPIAVSVLAAAVALRHAPIRRWVIWLGTAAGATLILAALLTIAALGDDGSFGDWGELPFNFGVGLMWLWMIALSVLLWRARPGRVSAAL